MEQRNRQDRQSAVPRAAYDPALPISACREQIIAAIQAHQVLVVAGETGSGKTTQLPRYCLDAGRGIDGMIACTQPRRIAARAMAARVSEELGCVLGEQVGFQVRFRERYSAASYIKFMTDGILLAEAVGDRLLRAYDTIVIDEAHERSLNIDFLLGYLKRLLPRRPELKVIITSATIDTEKFSRHFDAAPIIEVSGRGYPVDVIYQPLDDADDSSELSSRDLYQGIGQAVATLSRLDPRGDMLVFLSGEREIHEARDFLQGSGLRHTEVLPLYARLSSAEQQRVFHPGAQRRIILTTNVAETSLTVPRIKFVIDSGLARVSRYAHRSRIQRLPIEPISRASAEQRKGRCGRLGPGTCIRLYSEQDFEQRPAFTEPEILRTSLASVILRMLSMGLGVVEDFPFIDRPAPRMINEAYQMLFELGAVDAGRTLQPLGRRLARWPLDVRLARMIEAGAQGGHLNDLLVIAAGLSIQDPRERPTDAQQAADEAHARFSDERSDFVALLRLWAYLREQRRRLSASQFRKLCRREYLAWQRVLEWFDLYQQLRDRAREQGLALTAGHADYEPLHLALLSALLSNVGQRDPETTAYRGARNRSFQIFPGSGLFRHGPGWLMAAEIVETSRPYARINAAIQPRWIEQQAPHLLKRHYFDPHYSRKQGRVMAWEQVSLFGLVLVEKRRVAYEPIDPVEARRLFILHALVRGELDPQALRRRHGQAVERLAFMQANEQTRAQLEIFEHKRRQRDVLVDEPQLEAFFDARLPPGLASVAALMKWLKSLDAAGLEQLHLGLEVLLREDAVVPAQDRYPDHVDCGGQRLALSYLFAPGDPADGVTLEVPLELLNTLDAERLGWLVPGLLPELVQELLRGLPKPLRRMLTPLPQFADAALAQLPADPAGSLPARLAASLGTLCGIDLKTDDFALDRVPEHLRMRVRVLDADGGQLDCGRDLVALQARLGEQARRRFMRRQGQGFNIDGLLDWTCGELPRNLLTADGVTAWPALVDQGEAVGLRLFDTELEAWSAHTEGVLRLLALQLPDRLRELQRNPRLSKRAQLAWAGMPDGTQSVAELVADLAWHSLYAAAGGELGQVRSAEDFTALLASVRQELGPVFTHQAALLQQVMEKLPALVRALERLWAEHPASAADLQAHLDDLVYPGFLLELEAQQLGHYPRYLQAVQLRLDALALDPARDLRLLEQLTPFRRLYENWLEQGNAYSAALDTYRWLLAEFRVSLFAQRLGTASKVSGRRLEEAWQVVLETVSGYD